MLSQAMLIAAGATYKLRVVILQSCALHLRSTETRTLLRVAASASLASSRLVPESSRAAGACSTAACPVLLTRSPPRATAQYLRAFYRALISRLRPAARQKPATKQCLNSALHANTAVVGIYVCYESILTIWRGREHKGLGNALVADDRVPGKRPSKAMRPHAAKDQLPGRRSCGGVGVEPQREKRRVQLRQRCLEGRRHALLGQTRKSQTLKF